VSVRLSRKLLYDADTLRCELLSTRVCDLRLKLNGSLLGRCVRRAQEEARAFGIALEPYFYLSDGYGCVQGTTNIGVGFWDADPLLRDIHADKIGRRRDEMDLVLLLKHEIGHAFCYGHKLYQLPEFRTTFGIRGNFFATYPEHNRYRYNPFSPDHVNPDGDHYAQKHPDDDFAETFATYLDTAGTWRERYRGRIGALRKIAFVGRLVRNIGGLAPAVEPGAGLVDAPVQEIRRTVAQFFRVGRKRYLKRAQGYVDDDLRGIFRSVERLQRPSTPAATLLRRHRKFIEASVRNRAHPKDPHVVADLLDKIRGRLKALGLVHLDEERDRALAELYGLVLQKTLLFTRFGTFRDV
jgi:ribosomal 50S subunit-associated protein YjgA (DUF615 family)